MRQKSIGEVLREARESRGWTFADIQRMTKIQARLVQALEYNDFEAIPDPDYTRSFLQRYAEVLDLDASVILHAYDSKSLVVYYEAGEESDASIDLRRNVKSKKARKSYLPLIYLLLAAIFILIFVAYIVSQRIQNQAITPPSTSYSVVSSTSDSSSMAQTTETAPSSTSSSSSEPSTAELTTSGGGSNLEVMVTGASKPVEVELSVTTATSWVSLSDTDLAGGATLSPENTTVTVTVPETVTNTTLTLGVVEGVTVRVAGQELDLSALTDQSGYISLTIE
jgi:cytoskeletal protein RodZ